MTERLEVVKQSSGEEGSLLNQMDKVTSGSWHDSIDVVVVALLPLCRSRINPGVRGVYGVILVGQSSPLEVTICVLIKRIVIIYLIKL